MSSLVRFTLTPKTPLTVTLESGEAPEPAPGPVVAPGPGSGPGAPAPGPPPAPPEAEPAPVLVEALTIVELGTRRAAGLVVQEGGGLALGAELLLSDGSRRDALAGELTWEAAGGGSVDDGLYTAGLPGQATVACLHLEGVQDDIDVTVVARPAAPPSPPPAPPVPDPGPGRVVLVDPAQEPGPDVPGIFHYCEIQSRPPAGCGRPSATGGLEILEEAGVRFLREWHRPTPPITVHGKWYFPATPVAWARWRVRWPADYLSHKPGNHKQGFFDVTPGGGTQRLERTGAGFGVSSGVAGDPVPNGTPRPPDGGLNFGGPSFYPPGGVFGLGWIEFTMAFLREDATLWQGWWIDPLEGGHRALFKGSKLENVLPGLAVKAFRYPDTLNSAPVTPTHLDIAWIEVVAGEPDPWGKLGDLK